MEFTKNAIALNISRDTAIAYGLVEPTAEERAEMEASSERFRARVRDAWHVYANALQALDNLTDPGVRAVLDLHAPDADGSAVTCRHCYYDTEMGDRTDWPCETVEAVAGAYGIALPETVLYRQ